MTSVFGQAVLNQWGANLKLWVIKLKAFVPLKVSWISRVPKHVKIAWVLEGEPWDNLHFH